MSRIYSAILLAIHAYFGFYVFSTTGLGPYCFQFTWPGAKMKNESMECAKNIPCMGKIHISDSIPNTVEIWNKTTQNKTKYPPQDSQYVCELKPENVCIKYAYIYNNAVVNISYFCGKVIEDQTTAITSPGCYAQHIEGYTIEVCVCRSRNNSLEIPCNATTRHTYSILITVAATIASLFTYKIFNIS